MILKELRLENYRGFTESTFPFNKNFNVIAGINGTGKTSILDCLSVLLSRFVPQITPSQGGQKRFSNKDVRENASAISVEMRLNCQNYPVLYALEFNRGERTRETKPLPWGLRIEIAKSYGYDKQNYADAAPLAAYYTTDRAAFYLPRKIPMAVRTSQSAAYLGALSNRRITLHDFVARYPAMIALQAEKEQASKPPFDADDKHMQSAHIEAQKQLINRNQYGETAINAIKSALKIFLEGFDDLDVKQNPPDLIIKKKGTRLSQAQLSDGERGFLALVIDLARRLAIASPASVNPLSEGEGIVLIDELELHLHPQWQREVVEKLRTTFPKIQFICTTHSPFIVQSLRRDELILLDDQIIGDYENRGLEEVTTKVMGIAEPNVTPRYMHMLDAAKEYYRVLDQIPGAEPSAVDALKKRLEELARPYEDNAAYQAFLEMQRTRKLKE